MRVLAFAMKRMKPRNDIRMGWNPGESAWDANVGPMNYFAVSVDNETWLDELRARGADSNEKSGDWHYGKRVVTSK